MASLGGLGYAAPGLAAAADNFSRGIVNAAMIKRQMNDTDQNRQLRERQLDMQERHLKLAEDAAGRKTVDLNGHKVTFNADTDPQAFDDWVNSFDAKDPVGWVQKGVDSGVIHSIEKLPEKNFGDTEEAFKLKLKNQKDIKSQDTAAKVEAARVKAGATLGSARIRGGASVKVAGIKAAKTTPAKPKPAPGIDELYKRTGLKPGLTDSKSGKLVVAKKADLDNAVQVYRMNGYGVRTMRSRDGSGYIVAADPSIRPAPKKSPVGGRLPARKPLDFSKMTDAQLRAIVDGR